MDDLALGWQHLSAGRVAEAERCLRRCVASNFASPEGWSMLGGVLFQQQKLDEAIQCYLRSLALRPDVYEVLGNLGVAYAVKRDFPAAEQTLRRAIAVRPNEASAHRNLGHLLRDQGKHAASVEAYQAAHRLGPVGADILSELGAALIHADRPTDAIGPLTQAAELAPKTPAMHRALGMALSKAKRPDDAEIAFRRALTLDPNDADNHNALGVIASDRKHFAAAEVSFREAIRLNPNLVEAHQNLGKSLRDQDKFDEAFDCFTTAIRLRPDCVEAYNNLGIALGTIGRHDEAIRSYDRALSLDPSHADAHKNRAIIKLVRGEYVEGFDEFKWRWRCPDFQLPGFTQPCWNGEPIAGRTILLISEQGLGDTIQFVRYAAMVKARGARVLLSCPVPLLKLFANLPGVDALVPSGDPLPPFDVYAPLLNLPAIFQTRVEDVGGVLPVPYLAADPVLVERWSERLGPRAPGERRVGIFWQGNPEYLGDKYRSAPLKAFLPLADVPGVKLISLQKNHGLEQIAPLVDRLPLLNFGDELDRESGPFQDTAALMSLLDVMVTVNSAAVHLAGALGVPTWLALSTDSDWRWIAGHEDSPWYPTVRIFRQKELLKWDEVLTRIAETLAKPEVSCGVRSVKPIAVEVAPGELIDKITILEIKAERITDPDKLANVQHELKLLAAARDAAVPRSDELDALTAELRRVNIALWDVEDALRVCEHCEQFDAEFIELARSVYKHNDQRAAFKRKVNQLLGSLILEEKSYRHGSNLGNTL